MMKKFGILVFIFLLSLKTFSSQIYSQKPIVKPLVKKSESIPIPGVFLVEFKENPKIQESEVQGVSSDNSSTGIERKVFTSEKYPEINQKLADLKTERIVALPMARNNVVKIVLPETTSTAIAIGKLKASPNIKRVEQNFARRVSFIPNDSYFRKNSASDPKDYYQWNLAAIKAPQAWDITKGGSNVKVAVIDTGVAFEDYTEGTKIFKKAPELAGVNILPGLRHISYSCGSFSCEPLPEEIHDSHPVDEDGHGTHVSMTIVQAMNNGSHATGIAPNVSLIPIRVAGEGGGMAPDDIIEGLEYARANGAQVVNLSLGSSSGSEFEKDKINELIAAGITIVAAAGNDAARDSSPPIGFPAGYPGVIAVGASRFDNMRSSYSQYGTPTSGQNVTLIAPGGQVIKDGGDQLADLLDQNNDNLPDGILQQTIIEGNPINFTAVFDTSTNCATLFLDRCISGNSYCEFDGGTACGLYQGTSMATPHVTAVVALMKSVNPSLSPDQIKNILIQTANKTIIPGYNQIEHGAGLLDAYAAVVASGGTPTCSRADLGNVDCSDGTGVINSTDALFLIARWRAREATPITDPLQRRCDLNQDNKVDEKDLVKLLSYWGQ